MSYSNRLFYANDKRTRLDFAIRNSFTILSYIICNKRKTSLRYPKQTKDKDVICTLMKIIQRENLCRERLTIGLPYYP